MDTVYTHMYTNDMAVDEHIDHQTGGPMLLDLTLHSQERSSPSWNLADLGHIFSFVLWECLSVFQLEMTSWFSR